MLTNGVHTVGNNCEPLHPSPVNIYDACALGEQNICWKERKNVDFCASTKAAKLTAPAHTYVRLSYVGVRSLCGRFHDHLSPHNLSSYKCCNSYVGQVGERRGGPLTPKPSVSLA